MIPRIVKISQPYQLLLLNSFSPIRILAEFSRKEFVEGAKAAVEYISGALSEGEFDRLASVVSPECLSHLR